ncbi:MAG: DUF2853 family protein [Saprospiraceae bacterium]|nr:DUF2853 family protein [Lewinella sp.]
MSKFDEAIDKYKASMSKMSMSVDEDLLKKVAKALGPSIYNADAAMVSCSDKEELARVKERFLIKKLGMADSPKLDEAISAVCQEMGTSNRQKHRAVFNYLLVKKLGQESKL